MDISYSPTRPYNNLTGQTFNTLRVLECVGSLHGATYYRVRCTCGRISDKIGNNIRKNKIGCSRNCPHAKKALSERGTIHGFYRHVLYPTWQTLRARCNNPKSSGYKNYGARGISVCERWDSSFELFLEDMGPTWEKGLQLDREDTNGNYEPANCRWATPRENSRNVRRVCPYRDVIDRGLELGLSRDTTRSRMRRGMTAAQALAMPFTYRAKRKTT